MGGVKISYNILPPGRVGIAFGSVKKSIITIQEIIDMIEYNDRSYQVDIECKQNFVIDY